MKVLICFALVTLSASLRVVDRPGRTMEKEFQTDAGPVTLIVGRKDGRAIDFDVPAPIEVKSQLTMVTGEEKPSNRRGRQMTLDDDGVPVIEGVREPDDPNDKRVFRNARVINNILIPDDANVENQVSAEEESELVSDSVSSRQGRILTGPIEEVQSPTLQSGSSQVKYYRPYYNPERTGEAETKFNEALQRDDHKIVTSSYSTSSGAPKQKSSKDVIYGSGFAADPQKRKGSFVGSSSNPGAFISQIEPAPFTQSFSPPINWTAFSPFSSQSSQANERAVSQQSGNFKFPTSSSSNAPFSSSFVGSTSSSGVKPVSNNIRQYGSVPYQTSQSNTAPSWASFSQQAQSSDYRVPSNQFSSSSVYTNQIRRAQQPSGVITPHQAFGEAGGLIHPGVVPANSQDFIIEDKIFQTHPGAPAFNIPVPRPTQFTQQTYDENQQNQQQYYNHPNHYPGYSYYPYGDYIEELDNRPLIDKMMDPLRRVGERVKEIASPVIDPVIIAGQRFGNRLRIPERMDKIASGTVDADALPIVGGAVAVATLGALGAYAASKYSFNDLRKLLPVASVRSSKSNAQVSDVLMKLADDLENEDPSFLREFTSSTSWLESNCAKRIFCTLVTTTIKEEEEKIDTAIQKKFEVEVSEDDGGKVEVQSRQARRFLDRELTYIEKQINNLVNSLKPESQEVKGKFLRDSAKKVVNAVKSRNCATFTCKSRR